MPESLKVIFGGSKVALCTTKSASGKFVSLSLMYATRIGKSLPNRLQTFVVASRGQRRSQQRNDSQLETASWLVGYWAGELGARGMLRLIKISAYHFITRKLDRHFAVYNEIPIQV